MTEDGMSSPSAESIPAADITYNASEQGITMTRTYPVKQDEADMNDFVIEVRASVLKKSRKRLEKLEPGQIPVSEILLGISTTLLGSVLGAFAGGITLATKVWGVAFYVIVPMITVGTFVAYFFYHNMKNTDASDIAQEVLSELPDPESESYMR